MCAARDITDPTATQSIGLEYFTVCSKSFKILWYLKVRIMSFVINLTLSLAWGGGFESTPPPLYFHAPTIQKLSELIGVR